MDATSISKFPIDQFPVELRVMVYEMSDPFDTFCTEKEYSWFENKSGCPYKKIPWARTIFLSSVLNDKEALELASIQTEYRKVKFIQFTHIHITSRYNVRGDFPRVIFCELIVLGGNLQALKWARTYRNASMVPKNPSGNRVYRRPFPWTDRVCSNAAKCGHFEMLKWAKEQGCPWDEMTFAMAAEFGDIQVLKWLKEQGCPWTDLMIYSAAFGGHLEVLKWLHEQPNDWLKAYWSYAIVGAAETGQLEVLMWFREKKYPMENDIMHRAASYGHFHVVKWLHDFVLHNFMLHDHFRHHSYPSMCTTVARNGHLEMLQWLRERGYPWDKRTTYQAKKRGHSEIFEWAMSHGCPYDEDYSENYDMRQSDSDEDDDELYDDSEEEDDMEQGDSDEDDDECEDELCEDEGDGDEGMIATSKRRRRG